VNSRNSDKHSCGDVRRCFKDLSALLPWLSARVGDSVPALGPILHPSRQHYPHGRRNRLHVHDPRRPGSACTIRSGFRDSVGLLRQRICRGLRQQRGCESGSKRDGPKPRWPRRSGTNPPSQLRRAGTGSDRRLPGEGDHPERGNPRRQRPGGSDRGIASQPAGYHFGSIERGPAATASRHARLCSA
jgi:hypothetical protein